MERKIVGPGNKDLSLVFVFGSTSYLDFRAFKHRQDILEISKSVVFAFRVGLVSFLKANLDQIVNTVASVKKKKQL